uniref:Uncharacterized protein n=1 Tax=viral metagenome TaxID=1070528 RepID=A0A6C0DGT9_9ZZZZ
MNTVFKYMYQASTPDSTTSHKKVLPVVLITTHGNYRMIQETTGTGIVDKVEEVKISQGKLLEGMKIHKIEAAGLGVCTITNDTNVLDVYENIKRYMHDERTLQQFVNELVSIFENIHKTHIKNKAELLDRHDDDNHEVIEKYAQAIRRGEMNTYQEINSLDNRDPNKKPLYYEKIFTRDIIEDSEENPYPEDLETYNNSEYNERINLIEPEESRFDTRYSGPRIQDIYDDVIKYQIEKHGPDDVVVLSGIIGYIKNIKKINEFIIVDLSCSTYNDVISKNNGKYSIIEPDEIDLARATRRLRRNSSSDIIRVNSRSPLTLVDRPRTRDNSPDRKGGKRTKKHTHKKMNRRRKLTHKRRKTCKNKKRFRLRI